MLAVVLPSSKCRWDDQCFISIPIPLAGEAHGLWRIRMAFPSDIFKFNQSKLKEVELVFGDVTVGMKWTREEIFKKFKFDNILTKYIVRLTETLPVHLTTQSSTPRLIWKFEDSLFHSREFTLPEISFDYLSVAATTSFPVEVAIRYNIHCDPEEVEETMQRLRALNVNPRLPTSERLIVGDTTPITHIVIDNPLQFIRIPNGECLVGLKIC